MRFGKKDEPKPEPPHEHTWLTEWENGKVVGYMCPCGARRPA